ncbi:MAG: IS110 family transposase [Friedmanniella sp.]
MAAAEGLVGGVDPHADTIHLAVLTAVGKAVGDAEFATTAQGYEQAVAFLTSRGQVDRVGVEGAAGYGAGISRALRAAGIAVVEVDRPSRAARRRAGKSDRLDAYHAARSVLAERTSPVKDPAIDGLRALQLARRSAVKARTAAANQLSAILVMAPDPVRARFHELSTPRLVAALLRCRGSYPDPTSADVLTALKMLAARHRDLGRHIQTLTARIDQLASAANPALRAAIGVGPEVAAQLLVTAGSNPDRLTGEASFAALCGVAPVPASSGKTRRHRLSRGGDRHANSALHRIALVRMSCHAPTRAYVARQRARGRSSKEILRLLKRAIAREVFTHLTNPKPVPDWHDLRPTRQAKNLTLTEAAQHFAVWPAAISRLERGLRRDDRLTTAYRAWLSAA